ncbi:MAG TPA: ribonuclease Z [Gammaproteobacteria bacterium]|nr:ribonuclease Z [Gammaproteobacteria bacterium]
MRPTFHPELVNGPEGDPALYVERLHERDALLFDLGEIPHLPPRKILRLTHVFVSHCHMDHFAGFDRLLRVLTGRQRTVRLFGPPGFIDRVGHKLAGYTWNLAARFSNELTFLVTEIPERGPGPRARFRVTTGFAREPLPPAAQPGGRVVEAAGFRVDTAILDHRIPCLAFALSEPEHLNIWKDRLEARGLAIGDWLHAFKQAVRAGHPADHPVAVAWRRPGPDQPATLPLGELAQTLLSRVRGQKVAYVVDAIGSERNARRIAELARGADRLYIEAAFLAADAERAADTYHLTARQAGEIARRAGVQDLVPFHFSSRYEHATDALRTEAEAAYHGHPTPE